MPGLLRFTGAAAALTFLFIGCGASFAKMSAGSADAMQTIGPEGGTACLQVWIDNAEGDRATNAQAALAATCEVIQGASFEGLLNKLPNWSNGRQLGGDVTPNSVRADVLALSSTPIHLVVAPVSGANARSFVAVDAVSKEESKKPGPNDRPAIQIDPERIDFWPKDKKLQACLIDTLAHELTHLIPVQTGSVESKYQDISHEDREIKAPFAFGHAAGCTYLGLPASCPEMRDCPGT